MLVYDLFIKLPVHDQPRLLRKAGTVYAIVIMLCKEWRVGHFYGKAILY